MANVLTLRNLRKITGAFEINDDAQCVVVNTAQGEVQVIDFANILAICNNTVFYYTSSALSAINSIEVENGMRKYTLVDGLMQQLLVRPSLRMHVRQLKSLLLLKKSLNLALRPKKKRLIIRL